MDRDPPEKSGLAPVVEELEFELVDEGAPQPASAATQATDAMVGVFRGMVKQRLLRWTIGAALWGSLLGWLAPRWIFALFVLWKLFTLSILLYGLWASRRHSDVLMKTFLRGMNRPEP